MATTGVAALPIVIGHGLLGIGLMFFAPRLSALVVAQDVVEGRGLKVEYDDGTVSDSTSEPGKWTYHGEHQPHRVINDRDTRYVNVLIELKSG